MKAGVLITAKHLGGNITIESDAEKGATFRFNLPMTYKEILEGWSLSSQDPAPLSIRAKKYDTVHQGCLVVLYLHLLVPIKFK